VSLPRVLVVGSNGLLGQKVAELFVRASSSAVTCASIEPEPVRTLHAVQYLVLDVTSRKDVRRVVAQCEPEVIINCAAMTNVDACERERESAWKINVGGLEHLVEAGQRYRSKIIHISSDYVFDGTRGPYVENDRPEPINYYGKTKLASENLLRTSELPWVVVRTMVLYGYGENVRPSFPLWVIEQLSRGGTLKIVDDQMGNPTLVDDLAFGIMKTVELEKQGIYHIAGRDIISRFEFARTVARVFGFSSEAILPTKTEAIGQQAARPLRSGLVTLKAEVELGIRPATAEEGLLVLKSQLSRFARRSPDRGPSPGQRSGRSSGSGAS
jgi:dTDP-4-dehydrorhamnose reductase